MATDLNLTNHQSINSDGSHLTAKQVTAIETYMRTVLIALDLAHWKVHVATDLPPEGALLMIEPTTGRRTAMLYVAENWWGRQSADEKRTDLTHEALHLAHHDMDEHVRRFIDQSGDIAEYVKDIFLSQFKTDVERMVDSLSYACSPLVPAWKDPK